MASEWLILGLAVSIMFNVLVLLILVGTGWGKEIVRRWWRAKTYKKGGWVNNLYFRNNNVVTERYIKKDGDGSVMVDKHKYAVNPKAFFVYEGIPTQIIIEGVSEPFDLRENDMSEKMSTAEIQKIITNNKTHDWSDTLRKYLPFALIITVLLFGLAAWAIYSNWQVYDIIVQGGTGTIMGR